MRCLLWVHSLVYFLLDVFCEFTAWSIFYMMPFVSSYPIQFSTCLLWVHSLIYFLHDVFYEFIGWSIPYIYHCHIICNVCAIYIIHCISMACNIYYNRPWYKGVPLHIYRLTHQRLNKPLVNFKTKAFICKLNYLNIITMTTLNIKSRIIHNGPHTQGYSGDIVSTL